jgi:hypothetical protein
VPSPTSSSSLYDYGLSAEDKRKRVVFTPEQTDSLRRYFIKNPYPTAAELDELANSLGLEARKVYTWFTNQRQMNKKYDR